MLLALIALTFAAFRPTAAEQCRLVHPDQAFVQLPPSPTPSLSPSLLPSRSSTTGPTPSTSASPSAFPYGQKPIRGVNLGGWFVLEPWITPSLFEPLSEDIIDEYTYGALQDDKQKALKTLEDHWNTWITEEDFQEIAAAGLNHVRIPIGYWHVPLTPSDSRYNTSVDPYLPGAWPHFLRALNLAKKYKLHTIVDLHGARGSQNGYDNSGQRTGNPVWGDTPEYVAHTLDVIRYISTNVGGMVDVIQLLNEAGGWKGGEWPAVIRQYWLDGYETVREAAGSRVQVMIGDAFLTVNSWEGFLTYPNAQGTMMDYHEYQIFSLPELARSHDEHVSYVCQHHLPTLTGYASRNIWTVLGEWSLAITDCAKWLNGRGIGVRWDGTYNSDPTNYGSCTNMTGSSSTFSSDYKQYLRRYWEVQVYVGEQIQGWVFWTWKAENADEWSYQKGLEGGWIPKDVEERIYPNICN